MERIYYSIKELSEMTGLPFSTLRYWEKTFPELRPHRNTGKTRFYTREDIELVKKIKFLREEQQLSIPAVQRRLRTDKTGVDHRQKMSDLLQEIRQELVEIRNTI